MAIEVQGTKIYMSTSTALATSASNAIGGVISFSGPGGEAAEIDITDFDSSAKSFIIGLRDEGSITLELLRDTSNVAQTDMIAARATRAKRKFCVDFSTNVMSATVIGSRLTFDGYVKGWSYSGSIDDALKVSAAIRVTGDIDSTKASTL